MIFIKSIRLRSVTLTRTFGLDVELNRGLNVIWANNSSGKSTLLQSIAYCLGMEKALSVGRDIPLPLAMREEIRETAHAPTERVAHSYVCLTIENDSGELLSLQRDVQGGADRRLVRTWRGDISSRESSQHKADFFLHDEGSATREAGFHSFLEGFLGWSLPTVSTFDGSERQLYLETVFPMFFVEQKRGWSSVQGPLPTVFRIQDLARRVMEFILDFDVGRDRRKLAELRKEKSALELLWREKKNGLLESGATLVRISGVPSIPNASFVNDGVAELAIYHEGEWLALGEAAKRVELQIAEMNAVEVETVDASSPDLTAQLAASEETLFADTVLLEVLHQAYLTQMRERDAIDQRLSSLEGDLKANTDVARLQKYGSLLGEAVELHTCPTCHQEVEQELLLEPSARVMGIDENIAFVRSQLDLYRSLRRSTEEELLLSRVRYRALNEKVQDTQSLIRTIKADLSRSSRTLSRTDLAVVLRLEAKLERWRSYAEKLSGAIGELREIAQRYLKVELEIRELGVADLTRSDREKLLAAQAKMQELLRVFNFTSFEPEEITLSEDTVRPQVIKRDEDGTVVERDIGFEVSASDGVRLKWAYYLALLCLSMTGKIKHLGLLVFDEPGQQQMKDVDLSSLLAWAAKNVGQQRQLLISTSENLNQVRNALKAGPHRLIEFDSYLLKPLSP